MPKRTTTADAENLAGEDLIKSIIPGRSIDPTKFQRLLDYYNVRPPGPDQSLSGVTLYFYRKFPKTDYRKTPGKKASHIFKIEGVTEDGSVNKLPEDLKSFVTERFGGGRYQIIITDTKREGDSELATTTVKVDEIKFSPILDTRELVTTDPETAAWITRQVQVGELARDDQGNICLPGEATQTAQGGDSAAWARVARDAINQNRTDGADAHAGKRAIDMVADTATEMLKRMAPKDPVEQFTAMAAAFKNNDGGGIATVIPLLIAQQQESTKVTLAMMEMISSRRNSAPAPTTDDAQGSVAVVERIMDMANKLASKESWLDQLKSLLPLILPVILARSAGGPGAAPAVDMARMMASAANGNGGPAPGATPVIDQRMIEDLAAHAWLAMTRNQDGSDYAAAIDVFFGPETFDTIHAMGKPAITTALLSTQTGPRFRENTTAFLKFVDDFVSYGDQATATSEPAAGGAPPPTDETKSGAPMGAV
jgi:hypothetical protein